MLPFSIHPANAPERRIAVRSPEGGAAVVLDDLAPDDPRGLWYADPGGFIYAVPDPEKPRLYLTVLKSVGGSPICISQFTGNDDQRWTVQLAGSQLASVRYPGMVATNHECNPDAFHPCVSVLVE